ncbi:MAG TPA: hypothetical protein PLS28_02895 [Clostridiales bacterium]|nr:hypothetical protein [Clostridiales bacterium]
MGNETKKEKKKEPGKGKLVFLQIISMFLFSLIGGLIQTVLQYVLPLIFDYLTAPMPRWLDFLYDEATLFDLTTAAGQADYNTYVVDLGDRVTVTWGYMLPFFLANMAANIFLYIVNKKYTFKSSAPKWHFTLYFVIMVATILFTTWLQGVCYPWILSWGWDWINPFARLLCILPAGMVQAVVFFVSQSLLLPVDPTIEEKEPSIILWLRKKLGADEAEAEEKAEPSAEVVTDSEEDVL